MEAWQSGLMHRSWKPTRVWVLREFESHRFRQIQKTLRIVGVDEIYDHHPQHISIDSPMARALLSKQVDDEIEVLTPTGKKHWYVNSIRYDRPESSEN